MGFQAVLDSGQVVAPAVDVLSQVLTPQQADKQYKGVTGVCPHCRDMKARVSEISSAHMQAALSIADLTVRYRSGSYDDGRMIRIMHFAHRAGFLQLPGVACLLCSSPDLARHGAVVKVIGRWAERRWPLATVRAEISIVDPGTPPQRFSPDISVYGVDGKALACIEYQRTPEPFEAFVQRHELRRRQFPDVQWFFALGTYHKSLDHRRYLHDRGLLFFRCSIDGQTGRLIAEEGKPPTGGKRVPLRRDLTECSEQSLIRALEQRQPPPAKVEGPPLDTSLDMVMLGAQAASPALIAQQRAAALQLQFGLGRLREKVAVQGLPVRVDGDPGWTVPGGLPRSSTRSARVMCVSPNGESCLIERRRIKT